MGICVFFNLSVSIIYLLFKLYLGLSKNVTLSFYGNIILVTYGEIQNENAVCTARVLRGWNTGCTSS